MSKPTRIDKNNEIVYAFGLFLQATKFPKKTSYLTLKKVWREMYERHLNEQNINEEQLDQQVDNE